jgi:F0F1-type ATP synthase assembly protein I
MSFDTKTTETKKIKQALLWLAGIVLGSVISWLLEQLASRLL